LPEKGDTPNTCNAHNCEENPSPWPAKKPCDDIDFEKSDHAPIESPEDDQNDGEPMDDSQSKLHVLSFDVFF